MNRLALEPVTFIHLGKLRDGLAFESLRLLPAFQKLVFDADAPMKQRSDK